MITDGSRDGGDARRLVERVAAAARAGVHLVQVRERGIEAGALTELVARCVAAVRTTRTRILVNDRVDVALAAGAHGVHLRGDSMPASRVRAVAPDGWLIGRSVHSAGEARDVTAAGGLDYLIYGTVFATSSKRGAPAAGVGALAEVVRATPLPVLAVGGVTAANAHEVAGSGAAGLAAIALFAQSPLDRLQVVVSEASLAFDTP